MDKELEKLFDTLKKEKKKEQPKKKKILLVEPEEPKEEIKTETNFPKHHASHI